MNLMDETRGVVERGGLSLKLDLLFAEQDHKVQRWRLPRRHSAFLRFEGKNLEHQPEFLAAPDRVQQQAAQGCPTDRHLKKCSYGFSHVGKIISPIIADLGIFIKFMAVSILFALPVQAKDFGVEGPVFEIKEPSLLDRILTKLNHLKEEGKLEELQKDMAEKVRERARNPHPVPGLKTTQDYRSWHYDPTLTVEKDIYDHKGTLVAKASMRVNPLDYVSFGDSLILIDGTQEDQVQWAQSQKGLLVLTKGSPFELMEASSSPKTQKESDTRKLSPMRRIYFDQQGRICQRFKVEAVPARISQDDKSLLIEEIPMTQGGNLWPL